MAEAVTTVHLDALGNRIEKRFDAVDRRFDVVDQRLGTVDRRLDTVDRRLGTIDGRLDTIEKNHTETMLAVADVITQVNDHADERFGRLEQVLTVKDRVDRIEGVLAEQFGRDVLARAGL